MLAAEFFAGIGLVRLGLERAGWSVVFANDIDPQKKEMYEDHFGPSEYYSCKDVKLVASGELPDVQLATASFPCTDLSLAGGRAGLAGKQSSAFWSFMDVLDRWGGRKPPLVLLENVPAFMTSHKGADFHEALLALNARGYAVDAFVLDAIHFVPQSRPRLFIVGKIQTANVARDGKRQRGFFESALRPKLLADIILHSSQVVWNLRDLPLPPKRELALENCLENIEPNSSLWWSEDRVRYILSQLSEAHCNVIERLRTTGSIQYVTAFRRMRKGKSMAEIRWDGIAGCLRTPKGGSAKQILICVDGATTRVRHLSPRECANLMGANGLALSRPVNQSLFGIGDAVCVPAITWIAENYLNIEVQSPSLDRELVLVG